VAGVRVGHRTIVRGESIRTGVTAILPHGGNPFQSKVRAAVHVGNGFGKAAGFLQVQELGTLETPIVLTNTLSVGPAIRAVVDWVLALPGNDDVRSVNAVVGETNDGYLNDIRKSSVNADDVYAAIRSAAGGTVEEGSVGAGTGTRTLGWKGGIGTASRRIPESFGGLVAGRTVGALVQSNFGGILTIDGIRVGERLGRYSYQGHLENGREPRSGGGWHGGDDARHGSCMIVLATDAPLSSRNLERLARRAILGLARTGSFMANGSGDFVIAFSTADVSGENGPLTEVPNGMMSPLFLAVVEAVEEAVYNSLTRATAVTGHQGRTVDAIPVEALRSLLAAER
jgi:D-aminopeptidase